MARLRDGLHRLGAMPSRRALDDAWRYCALMLPALGESADPLAILDRAERTRGWEPLLFHGVGATGSHTPPTRTSTCCAKRRRDRPSAGFGSARRSTCTNTKRSATPPACRTRPDPEKASPSRSRGFPIRRSSTFRSPSSARRRRAGPPPGSSEPKAMRPRLPSPSPESPSSTGASSSTSRPPAGALPFVRTAEGRLTLARRRMTALGHVPGAQLDSIWVAFLVQSEP